MPATIQEISAAVAAFTNSTDGQRRVLDNDAPGYALARKCVDEIGSYYDYTLSATDWAYTAAEEILRELQDDAYDPADPPYFDCEDDTANEIADRLTDIYDRDLILWFSNSYTVCSYAEYEYAEELGGLENAPTLIDQISAYQNRSYYNAARYILYLLRDWGEDRDEEEEEDSYYTGRDVFCSKCTKVIYEHERHYPGNLCERCAQEGEGA